MALPPPNPTYSDDLYVFHWPTLGVECLVEGFSDRKEDIACELTVNLDHPLAGGRLYSGRLLLLGPNSRRDVRRALDDRFEELDWDGILEQLCLLARERYRRGEPPVDLSTVQYQEQPRWLLRPFIVRNGISILYGDGGTAKSLKALKWCVELAMVGVRTLYSDWEDDSEVHAERLAAICAGMDIALPEGFIFYQRRHASLSGSLREVRRFVAEQHIEHLVVDSVGMAAGDPMDHGLVIEQMRAARSLSIAVTMIHHLPKDAKDKTKPFGTVYASNEARITWLVEKAQEEDSDRLDLVLTNYKFNRGRLQGKRAYRVAFLSDEDSEGLIMVSFEETEIGQLEAFRSKLPQRQLIVEVLKKNNRALSSADILSSIEAGGIDVKGKDPEGVIRAVLNRHRIGNRYGAAELFIKIGEEWGLLTRP